MGLDINFYKRIKCPKCGETIDVNILYWGKDRELHVNWALELIIPPERELLSDSSTYIFELSKKDIESLQRHVWTDDAYKDCRDWLMAKVNVLQDAMLCSKDKLIYNADW